MPKANQCWRLGFAIRNILFCYHKRCMCQEWRYRNNQPERHTLYLVRFPAARRPKSLDTASCQVYKPANIPAKVIRCSEWRKRLRNKPHIYIINLHEELAKGYDSPWTTWRYLNRLRTGYTCSKSTKKGKSGISTQETPHVLVEKQKKLRHTCYSAPNSYIPALWVTLLCSMMYENNARNKMVWWFDGLMTGQWWWL